jgi:hypothetical protein
MKVSVTAKVILDDKLGKLIKDQVVDLSDQKANFYIQRGDVILYQTKVVHERPVAPEVSVEAEEVDKKRGRKPKTWLTK